VVSEELGELLKLVGKRVSGVVLVDRHDETWQELRVTCDDGTEVVLETGDAEGYCSYLRLPRDPEDYKW
jgi:hypothetical protein